MRRRTVLTMLAALALASGPGIAQEPRRIVAVGDLHGDWPAWRAIARAAGLVDEAGRWTGGKTILVQTGDVPDRGSDTLKIIEELMRLQKEARAAGGQVVALVGNHEAMNVTGDLRYVDPGEYAAFATPKSAQLRQRAFADNRRSIVDVYRRANPQLDEDEIRDLWFKATPLGMIEHRAAWRPDGRVGRWVTGNPAVALIDGTIFVHGGIGAAYAKQSIEEINRAAATALKAADARDEAIINDQNGPLWYRGYAPAPVPRSAATPGATPTPPPAPAATPAISPRAAELDTVLKAYGAKRMVIAHTPVLSGIVIAEGGRLIRIDTGISRAYRGKPSYLEIRGDTVTPHLVERPIGGE